MKLRILRLAENDIYETRRWYDRQEAGTGTRFIKELRVTLNLIEQQPEPGVAEESNPFPDRTIKRMRISGFPLRVVYELLEDKIHVLAIVHESRNPGYWA